MNDDTIPWVETRPGKTSLRVVVTAWNRETDQIIEYRVVVDDIENAEATRHERALDEDDEQWLRKIGARP